MFDNTEIAFSHLSDKALKKAYWLFKVININFLVKIGPALTNLALKLHLPVLPLIRSTIFEHFCGGETIEGCEDNIVHLSHYGVGTILDYSVEAEKAEEAFDATAREVLDTVRRSGGDEKVPFSVFKFSGIARLELLEKVSRLEQLKEASDVEHVETITGGGEREKLSAGDCLSPAEENEFARVKKRVDDICGESFRAGTPVLIDAEESWFQPAVHRLALEMMKNYNREKAIVHSTYQCYQKSSLDQLKADTAHAVASGFYLGAKLVRGAYMEKERERAEEEGYPSPIHANKAATDHDFDAAVIWCLDHIHQLAFMAGTHNEKSCLKLVETMKERGLPPDDERIYFAQLMGMSDNISFNLAHRGYRVAKYMPYGPVKSVLPYLFRRAQENTAIAGQMGRELGLIINELRRRNQ